MKRLFLLLLFLVAATPSHAGVLYQGPFEFTSGDPERASAKVYLPRKYSVEKQWPLVMLLHGYTATGDAEDLYMGLHLRVSKRGFILVVPNSHVDTDGKPFWNATDACCDFQHTGVNDVEYLLSLLKQVRAKYQVDPGRIYLVGHSNGGFMVNRLSCEAKDVFAGIASLAGEAYKDPALCRIKDDRVSMLQIQALDDPTIHYDGDKLYPGARETVAQWLARDGCEDTPTTGKSLNLTWSIPGDDATPLTWTSCQEGTEVALWTIKAYQSKHHNPHIPLLSPKFTDLVLDFLFSHSRKSE